MTFRGISDEFALDCKPPLVQCDVTEREQRNGFTEAGLPLSIQIVGRPFEDALVLRTGHRLEQALGFRARRPAIAALD